MSMLLTVKGIVMVIPLSVLPAMYEISMPSPGI